MTTLGSLRTIGIVVSPSHGKESVVTGIRIYTANNSPNTDPVKIRLEGGAMSGALVTSRHNTGFCWAIVDYWVKVAICDSNDPTQRMYMNSLGEIRVRSHPGLCMDPRYGMSSSYYENRFIGCYSDRYGPTHSSAQYQKFTYDAEAERIKSTYYNNCVDWEFNRGVIFQHGCHGGDNQKFFGKTGSFDAMSDSNWNLIHEGYLPWVSEFDRNPSGVAIYSNYEAADPDKYFMEKKFYDSVTPYYEYRIKFLELRDPDSNTVQFSELELPGLLVDAPAA